MGSSSKTKPSSSKRRILVSGANLHVAGNDDANVMSGSAVGAKSVVLIPLDRIDIAVKRHVRVGTLVGLVDDGSAIAARWKTKRLGDVRQSYVAKVRAASTKFARVAEVSANPVTVSLVLVE